MGQTLSWPALGKTTEEGENGRFIYAITEMQGWRINMEDAHAIALDLDKCGDDSNSFFAVYDGHGGGTVAKFAGENVHKRLVTEEPYKAQDYGTALKKAFLGTDEDLLANPRHARDPSGCTAVAALVTKDKIYVANAGDSRSVLSVKGEVKPLSFDHKPTNESEKARISSAGGYVEYGRVNGNLALSRAIGDFEFKKNYTLTPERQIITSDPDITVHDINEEDEFLVLACDGIWDCLSNQTVVDFIRSKVAEGKELSEIGGLICDHCIAPDTNSGAGIGCDNMTILIVALLHGRTKEEWYSWITDRVKNGYGYNTPSTIPQLYAQHRLMHFKARREAMANRPGRSPGQDFVPTGLDNLAQVLPLGSTGGISFHPGSGIFSDSGGLMFHDLSYDEDDSDDEESGSFFTETLGLGATDGPDPTRLLKAKISEFEKEEEDTDDEDSTQTVESGSDAIEVDDHGASSASSGSSSLQGEAPPPPKANGDVKSGPISPMPQLHSEPGGDKASAVVEAEGLMDTSEDPLKV